MPELHPACAAFPELPSFELDLLADDLKKNGQREPITMFMGMILDGRLRWKACLKAGIEPQTIEYEDDDPIAFVLSKNRYRRHLSKSQRAMAAARLANLGLGSNQFERKSKGPLAERTLSTQKLADQSGISVSSVDNARAVLDKAEPHIVAMVDQGDIGVRVAFEAIRNTNRTIQATWGKEDVQRIGREVIKNYPSSKTRTRTPAAPAKKPKPRFINPPYQSFRPLSAEERGLPPPGSSLEERWAHAERNGRVQLFADGVKERLDGESLAQSVATSVLVIASPSRPGIDQFFAALEKMSDWTVEPGVMNGRQIDFPRKARAIKSQLRRDLPLALAYLQAISDRLA